MGKSENRSRVNNRDGAAGGALFVAYMGAAVYFVQNSTGFLGCVWALIEALVWPASVLYKVLGMLNA